MVKYRMSVRPKAKRKSKSPAALEAERQRLERKAARQGRRRDEIIEAAAQLATQSGLDGFTADDVARALSMSSPSVFYYFPGGLSELRAAVAVRRFHARFEDAVSRAGAAASGVDALIAYLRGMLRAYLDDVAGLGTDLDVMQRGEWGEALVALHIEKLNAIFSLLEGKLEEDRDRGLLHPDVENLRRLAMLMNQMALGLVVGDQLRRKAGGTSKHAIEAMLDDLCGLLERAVRR